MHARARTTKQNYDRGSLQQVCLEAHNIGSARQFQADDGVQSIEGMEAVQKQLHGAFQDEDPKKCSLYNCFRGFPTYQ